MDRRFVVVAGGAAVVIASVAGCSSQQAPGVSQGVGSGAKVLIDGQNQNVQGSVVCQVTPAGVQIGIGSAGTVAAQLSGSGPLTVQQVSPGKVNGVTLVYQKGNPIGGGSAQATKSGNSYTITGTATGIDPANPMQPVSKPFEIDATCP